MLLVACASTNMQESLDIIIFVKFTFKLFYNFM